MGAFGYRTASIGDLLRTDGWAPIRRSLGIRSFGTNAWTAAEVGADIIEEHVELTHEELYVVVEGHARFTVDGTEIDGPPGTLLLVSDPGLWRSAVALAPNTVVLTIGGEPGAAFEPSSWETNRDVLPLFREARYEEAKAVLAAALAEYSDPSGLLYNLACADAQLGNHDEALGHLRRAIAMRPELAALATEDSDLMLLRDDPRFDQLTNA